MDTAKVIKAVSAAKRFRLLTEEALSQDCPHNQIPAGKLSGELRRASLDLTRRLAEMRKP